MKKLHYPIFIIIVLLAVMLVFPPVYGGDASRTGTAAGTQLQVPVGARDLAMSGANVAKTSSLEAIYWNPAGLSSMKYRAMAMFSTMNIFFDTRVNYLALAANFGRLGLIGFSLKAFDFGDIPFTTVEDMDGSAGRTFSPTFVTVGVTYSKRLTDRIQVGLNAKVVYESIPSVSASTLAFDAGIQYHNLGGISGLSFGAALRNIGGAMQYKGSGLISQGNLQGTTRTGDFVSIPTMKNELPASVEIGLAYERVLTEDHSLIVAGRFLNNNFSRDAYNFGVEYRFRDLVALRGGYNYRPGLNSDEQMYRFTLGAGVNIKLGNNVLIIDYAYRDARFFDGNNLFSLKVGF